jgi:choline dehydrogenase
MLAFFMKPYSRGRVSLRSKDPVDPPMVEENFVSDARDANEVVRAIKLARELGRMDPLAPLLGHERTPGADVDVAAYVKANARGYFHPVGTCAIDSVVDLECRVLGIDSLFVADASVMPTIPRANTNLTVAAIAERVAALIDARA